MSNNPVNELLSMVTPPKKDKKPSNWALYAVLWVSNLIFLVLDVISGFTVYLITGWWLYGLLTALAGFVPLLLHEASFIRAYASNWQKWLSMIGAGLSVISVMLVGVAAAAVNVIGVGADAITIEIVTVASLVLIAGIHAVLFIVIFYIDDGIQANQRTQQAVAMSLQKSQMLAAAGYVLKNAEGALVLKKALERQHGPQGAEALQAVLSQLLQDGDGNGIPDILEGKRPAHQYNQTAERVPFRENGHGSELPNE